MDRSCRWGSDGATMSCRWSSNALQVEQHVGDSRRQLHLRGRLQGAAVRALRVGAVSCRRGNRWSSSELQVEQRWSSNELQVELRVEQGGQQWAAGGATGVDHQSF